MNDTLLEQYKLYVEMADRISQRRLATNRFFISMLSALGGLYLILEKTFHAGTTSTFWALLTIAISSLWWVNINSYRQLNTGKFKVIHEMEQQLPFACFDKEWKYLGQGKNNKRYLQLTKAETYLPVALIVLSLVQILLTLF